MAPTVLIVGATGNTGRSVVETLPKLLQGTELAFHRTIALTRSKDSAAAQKLAKISGVEVAEKNRTEIDDQWLREREVVRVFIAAHNNVSHFAEESQLHLLRSSSRRQVCCTHFNHFLQREACKSFPSTLLVFHSLHEIKHCPAYYPRAHWAIESTLSQPEFEQYHWTSLQPNIFATQTLAPVAEFIKEHKKAGKQGPLSLIIMPTRQMV